MPYNGPTDPDLPSNVQDEPLGVRRQWVSTFNHRYNLEKRQGSSDQAAESAAFKLANGVLKQRKEDE